MNPLRQAHQAGQSLWLDNLSRSLLREGGLKKLIEDDGISGLTSNPSIFQKSIAAGTHYREDLRKFQAQGRSAEQCYEQLVVPDIQAACDMLHPVYEKTHGEDGFVSLEVSPLLAYDQAGTVAEALRLHAWVDRRNLLVKVPGTPQGVGAVEQLIGQGISVNVTLLFSLKQVEHVAMAYQKGLEAFHKKGGNLSQVRSVASLFLSRVDTLVDKKLNPVRDPAERDLLGQSAVAMAKLAYQEFRCRNASQEMMALMASGARPQWLLWASTGTKNPAYSDVLYVEPLVGPQTINTMPDATIEAFRDHGKVELTLEKDLEKARFQYQALSKLGIDMEQVGQTLQKQGVELFRESFTQLMDIVKH